MPLAFNNDRWEALLILLNQKRVIASFAPITYTFSDWVKQSDIDCLRNGTIDILSYFGYTLATALTAAGYGYSTWKTWDYNWIAEVSLDEIEDILNILVYEPPQDWSDLYNDINSRRTYINLTPLYIPNPAQTYLTEIHLYQESVEELLTIYGYSGLSEALHHLGYIQDDWSSGFACYGELHAVVNSMIMDYSVESNALAGKCIERYGSHVTGTPYWPTPEEAIQEVYDIAYSEHVFIGNTQTVKGWEYYIEYNELNLYWCHPLRLRKKVSQYYNLDTYSNVGKIYAYIGFSKYSNHPEIPKMNITLATCIFGFDFDSLGAHDPIWTTVWNTPGESLIYLDTNGAYFVDVTDKVSGRELSFTMDDPIKPAYWGGWEIKEAHSYAQINLRICRHN